MDGQPSDIRCSDGRREAGFSIIELLVVMVIIGILMAAAVWALQGQKRAARGEVTVATARAYADAVTAYAADHNGRVPVSIGAAGWPVADSGPTSPLARSANGGRYLRTIPESVQDRTVRVGATSGPAGAFTYASSSGATKWTIRVYDRSGVLFCYTGTQVAVGVRKCRDVD